MIDKKQKGINWGPFTLRIPFIHLTLLPSEFLQGLVISGATAFAGAPIVMALVYFVILTPISIIVRVFGKDLLGLKFLKEKETYWIKRKKNLGSMKKQF